MTEKHQSRIGSRSHYPILILISLMFLALASRATPVSSEGGADVFELHAMAGILQDTGRGGWLLNPLSAFGLYTLSYPSGVPAMAAVFSSISGMELADAMIFLGFGITAVGVLTMFVLAHYLSRSYRIAVIASALLAFSNSYDVQCTLGLTGRAAFTAFFPMLALCMAIIPHLFKGLREASLARLVAAALIFLAILTTHRLALFALLYMVVAIAVYVSATAVINRLAPGGASRGFRIPGVSALLIMGVFGVSVFAIEPGSRQSPTFLNSFIFSSDRTQYALGWLIETGYNYGPALGLLPFGAWYACQRMKENRTRFTFSLLMAEALLFGSQPPALSFWVFAIPNSLVVAYAFDHLHRGISKRRISRRRAQLGLGPKTLVKRLAGPVIVGALVLVPALALNQVAVNALLEPHRYADGTSFFLDEETFAAGMYLAADGDNSPVISQDIQLSMRLASASGDPTLSTLTNVLGNDPELLANATPHSIFEAGSFRFDDLMEYLTRYKAFDSLDDPLFPGQALQGWSHWVVAIQSNEGGRRVREYYSVTIFVETVPTYFDRYDRLTQDVRADAYQLYANDLVRMYYIKDL